MTPGSSHAATVAEPRNRSQAEALLATPASSARDRALRTWAEKHASLGDLVALLRLPPERLGANEGMLAQTAFDRTPADRAALRRRLGARLALANAEAPRGARGRSAPNVAVAPVRYPRASVFRVGAILPDSGSYGGYGRSVLEGLRASLIDSAGLAIEVEARASGEDRPAMALAAFDSVAPAIGSAVGELLSVPTLVLAAAARYVDLPLVSPTATDEEVGTLGSSVFQIGPSAYLCGERLALAILGAATPRVGVLISSAAGAAMSEGFMAAARARGARVVWQDEYPAGTLNFRDNVRALVANQVELLFWDGEAREAEALVRQLARDQVSMRLCGGSGLDPANQHSEARVLLEGVQYAGNDWQPSPELAAVVERAVPDGGEREHGLALRGWLAGRMLRAAVASGALCPEEIRDWLAAHRAGDEYLKDHGFLDLSGEDVSIPVYTVRKGKGVTP